MVKIISGFNSSIPSVRKVKNWLQNEPHHIWHGRDRLVVFFVLAGDEAANAFIPLEDADFSEQDESIRVILESNHQQEQDKRAYYQQAYLKLCKLLDSLDDLNMQALALNKVEDSEEYALLDSQIQDLHLKLLDFINDVFVWRDHKDMGAMLGEIEEANPEFREMLVE